MTLITDPMNPPMDKINHALGLLKNAKRTSKADEALQAAKPKSAKGMQRDAVNETRRAAERRSLDALRATLASMAKGWVTLMTAEQVAEIVTAVTAHGHAAIGVALKDAAKGKLGSDTSGHVPPKTTSTVPVGRCVKDLDNVEDAIVVNDEHVLQDLDLSQVHTAA